jgi:hypothetical protein
MTITPAPVPDAVTARLEPAGDQTQASTPQFSAEGVALTWESLHSAIAAALRRVDLGAPLYVAADVLTDELLPSLKGVGRPAA